MRIPENLSALLKKIKISKNKFKIEVNNKHSVINVTVASLD